MFFLPNLTLKICKGYLLAGAEPRLDRALASWDLVYQQKHMQRCGIFKLFDRFIKVQTLTFFQKEKKKEKQNTCTT